MNKEDKAKLLSLLIELKKKDEKTLHELMELMHGRLLAEARRFFNDQLEAESITNLVFSKLWYKADKYDESRPPLPYVISVLRNYCRDCLRKKERSVQTLNVSYPPKANNSDSFDYDGVLRDALPPDLFELVERHCINNESLKVLAKERKIPISDIKIELDTARVMVSNYLNE